MGDGLQTLPTTVATAFLFLQDPQRGSVAAGVLAACVPFLLAHVVAGPLRPQRRFAVVAAPSYLERRSIPQSPAGSPPTTPS